MDRNATITDQAFTVYITDQDLTNGWAGGRYAGTIALAIKQYAKQIRCRSVAVKVYTDQIEITHKQRTVKFNISAALQRWICNYTDHGPLNSKRISVTLDPVDRVARHAVLLTRTERMEQRKQRIAASQ